MAESGIARACSRAITSGGDVSKFIRRARITGFGQKLTHAAILSFFGVSLVSASAFAATDTWLGGGSSTSWSDTGNWSTSAIPGSGDDVIIAQTGTYAPSSLNIAANLNSLTFLTAGAGTNSLTSGYTINTAGGSLTLGSGGSIVDSAVNGAADTINSNIALTGPTNITVTSGATGLVITGNITGTGPVTVTNSSGASALQFLGTNTYTGGTTIASGTLQLGNGGTSGSIIGNVTDNGTLAFDRSDTVTFSGLISGSGSVNQMGSGTTILTAANTYSGGTTITAGTLQLGNGGTSGSIIGNVTDNGTLAFDRSDTVTFGGVISGSGSVKQMGSGTTILTATDTYSGGTTITAGTLQIGNGGTTGSITGSVVDNGTLAFDRSDAVNFSGVISGSGGVTQMGSGTLTLSGSNSYAGGTLISGGTLAVSYDNNLGAASGTIEIDNSSTLELDRGFTTARNVTLGTGSETINAVTSLYGPSVFTGVISGAGGLNLTGSGMLVLANDETYTGGTTISATSTLSLGMTGVGSTTGSVVGAITDNGTLQLNRTDNVTFSNTISGTGRLQKYQTDTLTLTGTNTYSGGTQIFAGTLQIGNGGTSGSISGPISLLAPTATIAFDHSDNVTYSSDITGVGIIAQKGTGTLVLTGTDVAGGLSIDAGGTMQIGDGSNGSLIFAGSSGVTDNGVLAIDLNTSLQMGYVISGTGSFQQIGSGTTTLGANNTYSGGTTISAGTLQIGAGGTTGSITGNVTDNATLAFNRSDTYTFGGVISGSGAVNQIGLGTTILTGTNTYSGGTTISGGTLQIGNGGTTGSITGDVTDNANLAFDHSDGVNFSGNISGFGSVSQIGSGTLTLSGSNTYSGGTNITSGTVAITSASNLGTGGLNFSNGATLQFLGSTSLTQAGSLLTGGGTIDTNGFTDTWSGTISGAGSLTKTGAGTLILTGSNSYSGGTTISAGTLQIGNGGSTGAITGDVVDNATLAFNHSSNTGFAGNISGSGIVEQDGSGTLTLSGTNTYTGGTNINAGTLSISSDSNLGNGGTVAMAAGTTIKITASNTFTHNVTVIGDPTFSVGSGLTATWSGLISDGGAPPGVVEVAGGGTLILSNASNSYSGGTIVRQASTLSVSADGDMGATAGGLQLGDASTSGRLDVTSSFTTARAVTLAAGGGTINTGAAVNLQLTTGIVGAGGLTVTGAGNLTLTGTSTYSGGTTISGGTLQLGDGSLAGMIAGNVVDNGALIFNEGGNATFTGVVSGTGSLTQNDTAAGTLILTGNNTYSGGTTVTSGTLQIGNGGTTGAITGNVTDNAALAFNRSDTLTMGGVISGSGSLNQNGTGTTILTGANTYSGGTTITAGTLQIGNGGSAGSISGNVSDGGTLAFNRSDTITFAGVISGAGSLTQMGSGTTILTATNTYGGGTLISAGTLQVGNGGTTGAITGNVTDNGTLAFNRSDSITFAGVISGAGSLTQMGSGTAILTGANTYTGGTTISAGTLQIGNGGTTGAITGNVTDNGAIVFDRSNSFTLAGAISGSGSLSQIGSGTTILTGANTYSGGTTISTGTLQIGNGGTSGSITGNVTDNATLAFNRSDSVTYGGVISGSGALQQNGTGTLVLTGANTYSGGTTISAGTLMLGNGGASGSLTGNVTDNGTLAFNRSNTYTYSGVISGSGGVSQVGSGEVVLTATNTYLGSTLVQNGSLLVDGSIASSSGVSVNSGGTIGGTGTIASLSVGNSGTLAPGDGGIGTLNVQGSVVLASGSTYAFDVTPSTSDLLNVTGSASLAGTLDVTVTGTGYTSTPIPVVTAGTGISGTFSAVSLIGNPGGGLDAFLTYDANNAYLVFMPSITSLVPGSAATTNNGRIAKAIDFAIVHDNGGLAFQPLALLSPSDLSDTLSQMTGETSTGVQSAVQGSLGQFLQNLTDPSIGARGGLADGGSAFTVADRRSRVRLAYDGPDEDTPYESTSQRGWAFWTNVYGEKTSLDGDASIGSHNLSSTQFGGQAGLNYTPDQGNGAVGIAVGLDKQRWKLAHDMGTGDSTAAEIGLYYSRRFDRNYFTSAFSYSRYDVTTDRTVDLVGTNVYHANFSAWSVAGRTEFGHTFDVGDSRLTPYVRFDAADIGVPSYAEKTLSGSSAYALSFTGRHHFDYTSEAGLGWNTLVGDAGSSTTDLHARLGWLHDYSGHLGETATFSAFHGASFTVDGASLPSDAAHLTFGLEHDFDKLALTVNADSSVGKNASAYGGSAALAFRW